MIHIVNGDVIGNKIKGKIDNIMVWREMYDFGPLSSSWSKEEQVKIRANFFEEKLGVPSDLFIQNCQGQDTLLSNIPISEEVVLWFEHDRFDQTMLMYLITELSSRGFENLSMISIDQYPGISPFYGMAQLSSEQLIKLLDFKQKLTVEQIHEAITGWKAYTSNNKADIEKWILLENHSLPFLVNVLKNHNSYFPSISSGLNEVESLALSFINDGVCLFYDLFQYIKEKRINDGLSNLHLAAIINELMITPFPLIKKDISLPNYPKPNSNPKLELTPDGLDVLKGKKNRINLVGIDWWIGGLHLRG